MGEGEKGEWRGRGRREMVVGEEGKGREGKGKGVVVGEVR